MSPRQSRPTVGAAHEIPATASTNTISAQGDTTLGITKAERAQ